MARRYMKVITVYKINHVSKFIFFFSLNSSIEKKILLLLKDIFIGVPYIKS